MSLRRSSSPTGRRALVAAGLTAALVAVPGTAAANETDPVDQVTSFLQGLATGGAPAAQEAPGLPAFAVPPEIRAAFQQLADAAMLPENCVDGVADAIELILNGLIALPLELAGVLADLLELLGGGGVPLPDELAVLEDLLDQLLGGLAAAAPAADEPAAEDAAAPAALDLPLVGDAEGLLPGGVVPGGAAPEEEAPEEEAPAAGETPELPTLTLVDGLVALGEALAACIPAAPAEEPEAPAPTTPPVVHPTPEQPAPPAPQPVAQPVAYLGYAPTGTDVARADDTSVPLTALGGGLVLVAAGAAGYGMRGRALRPRG